MSYYVVLLLQLSRRPLEKDSERADAQTGDKRKAEDSEIECGRDVLEDLSTAFRSWVEAREWLNMRLCVSDQAFAEVDNSFNSFPSSCHLDSSRLDPSWNYTNPCCLF